MKKFLIFSIFLIGCFISVFFFPKSVEFENKSKIKENHFENQKILTKKGEFLEGLEKIREDLIQKKEEFLEVNLAEMKIYFYKEGKKEKEIPIFRRGDPEKWGGTPLGLYEIQSKNDLAYSALANSYMPWSLKIYGKYYLHGDNWYLGRGIDTSPITGGCVRLLNKNAQDLFKIAKVKMPVLVVDKGIENEKEEFILEKEIPFPKISAKSYLVADLESGFVFAKKNELEKWPIASLTKLMTAVVVAEFVDLRKSITISKEMLAPLGYTPKMEEGKSFKAVELFWPLLIQSSNDAAEALSRFLGRQRTVQLMNEKTKSLLMENTHFVDPSGLSPENFSTAKDLFYLIRYIFFARPVFLKISKGEKVWTFNIPISFKNLKNKNIFFENPNFLGGKTGFIKESQGTGIFVFRLFNRENKEKKIAIILLGSFSLSSWDRGLKEDTEKILQWLKESYHLK